jgi:hypothetical protein
MKQHFSKFLLLMAFILFIFSVNAQQQESYTYCTGGSYAYFLDTTTTSTSTYYQRFNIGTTSYTSHFYRDTIYQSSGSSSSAGGYGSIKKYAWTGNNTVSLVWTYTLSGAHHDICPMPNGNVLVIIDESKVPSSVGGTSSSSIKSTVIKEIHPTGTTTGTVVWEWHLWDHLCQSTNTNYSATYVTNIAQHPERFNVNCTTNGGVTSDWFHMNGVDYNPTRDQIVLSSHIKNEIYVIDHSTTTAEAATHAGGNAGMGGDFLYRWGSPENYGCTTDGNGVSLNVIHDARWVPSTNKVWPNYISVFHNGGCTSGQGCVLHLPTYSTTNPYTFIYTPGSVVGPTTATKPVTQTFTVSNMGGCQALENGNVLITKPNSAFYETRNSGTALQSITVSTVQSSRLKKVDLFGPWISTTASSSNTCVNNSISLNCPLHTAPVISNPSYTYSWVSVPATANFSSTTSANPTVTPTAAGTYTFTCTVNMSGTFNATTITTTTSESITVVVDACTDVSERLSDKTTLTVYPNPTTGMLTLNETFVDNNDFVIQVYDAYGNMVKQLEKNNHIDISNLPDGVYYLTVVATDKLPLIKKIILIK